MAFGIRALTSADADGYSRLMATEQEETLRTLTAHRKQISMLLLRIAGASVDAPGFPEPANLYPAGSAIALSSRNSSKPGAPFSRPRPEFL